MREDDWLFLHIGIFLLLIFFDQLTKIVTQRVLVWGESIRVGFFSITHISNPGASFGLFPEFGTQLIIIALVALVLCVWFYAKFPANRLAIIIISAGIMGNVIDRFLYGSVVDMIDLHFFPVFNIADMMIFLGILSHIIFLWKEDIKEKKAKM